MGCSGGGGMIEKWNALPAQLIMFSPSYDIGFLEHHRMSQFVVNL